MKQWKSPENSINMSKIRQRKVADAIKRELSNVINMELKHPGKGMITITHVRVTADLGIAYIYISVMGDEIELENNLQILEKSSGFLRSTLGRVLKSRKVPSLKFFKDDTLDYFNKIDGIIDKMNDSDSESNEEKNNDA
jgi:ribosome-binding factor A